MQYILVLGDGNFSFSKSLLHALYNPLYSQKYHVVTTSFDSRSDVLRKYPEAKSTFSHMSRNGLLNSVVHGVDATQPLQNVSARTSEYEYVIFNFPHLGIEDCHRHAALMGHILYRIKTVLSDIGIFYLTLADQQPQNWRLEEMCSRNGFKIKDILKFDPASWQGYELRRHHCGASFQRKATTYITHCLVKSTAENIRACLFTDLANQQKLAADASARPQLPPGTSEAVKVVAGEAAKRGKKRKMDVLTAGMYARRPSAEADELFPFVCTVCGKGFKHEQGARTHTYTMHVLGSEGRYEPPVSSEALRALVQSAAVSSSTGVDGSTDCTDERGCSGEERVYICDKCDPPRSFGSSDAFYQHFRSKHVIETELGSKNTTTNPACRSAVIKMDRTKEGYGLLSGVEGEVSCTAVDMKTGGDEHGAETADEEDLESVHVGSLGTTHQTDVECPACGEWVPSVEVHMKSLQPPDHPELVCENCGKIFHSERSLGQHRNFCNNVSI